jgi:hypothetical protein
MSISSIFYYGIIYMANRAAAPQPVRAHFLIRRANNRPKGYQFKGGQDDIYSIKRRRMRDAYSFSDAGGEFSSSASRYDHLDLPHE